MGAIASGGVRVMNEDAVSRYRPTAAAIEAVTRAERTELERRERVYRDGLPAVSVEKPLAVLIDNGLATGATMRAAVHRLERHKRAHECRTPSASPSWSAPTDAIRHE
jgi:predicted phosphoribosyltransferase